MKKIKWVFCPICGGKTRAMIRDDTELRKYPLFCPKCKQETLIEAKNLQITVIKEPDALDAEPIQKTAHKENVKIEEVFLFSS